MHSHILTSLRGGLEGVRGYTQVGGRAGFLHLSQKYTFTWDVWCGLLAEQAVCRVSAVHQLFASKNGSMQSMRTRNGRGDMVINALICAHVQLA